MDTQDFSTISNIIKTRRTIKPAAMNGQKIPNSQIAALLELADWAPTHAHTEPWRFVIYENPQEFCRQHAEIYKQAATEAGNFNPATYNNLTHMGDLTSHIVIPVMHRGELSKIPVVEEVIAASCAVQNLLLGARALNIAAYWGTGGATLKPGMKTFLGFGDDDQVLGLLYLGYSADQPDGKRKIPLEEKVRWVA